MASSFDFDSIKSLRLAASISRVLSNGDRIVFVCDGGVVELSGTPYAHILALVGQDSPGPSLRNIASQFGTNQVQRAFNDLLDRKLIATSPIQAPQPIQAFWDDLSAPPGVGAIELHDLCQPPIAALAQSLRANRLAIQEGALLRVILTNDYLNPALAGLLNDDRPSLLVKPTGTKIWIGPLIQHRKSACYSCAIEWLRAGRWKIGGALPPGESIPAQASMAALPSTLITAVGIIATAAAQFLASGECPVYENTIVELDVRSMMTTHHALRSRDGCLRCGNRNAISALQGLVSPLTGLVSEIQVMHVPIASFFYAFGTQIQPPPAGQARAWLTPVVVAGRGQSPDDARAACLGEAAERYSTVWQGTEPVTRARVSEIDSIAPSELLHFSDAQYENRGLWNLSYEQQSWVPERFDIDEPIDWTPATSLVTGKVRYVPAAFAYLWYPFEGGFRFCAADSNGCAAGRSREGALLNGLLELVERDAVAVWWYNRLRRPALDLSSVRWPIVESVREYLINAGRNLYVLDLTHDLGIPACVAAAPKNDGSEILFATAAHFSPRRAVEKALGELVQMEAWNSHKPRPALKHWLEECSLENSVFFAPNGTCPLKHEPVEHEVADMLDRSIDRVTAGGLEFFYIELTRPELGIPAARVIVPGMRHFWARFGAGRLYQVPVRMGWIPQPLAETDLNPIPCML